MGNADSVGPGRCLQKSLTCGVQGTRCGARELPQAGFHLGDSLRLRKKAIKQYKSRGLVLNSCSILRVGPKYWKKEKEGHHTECLLPLL